VNSTQHEPEGPQAFDVPGVAYDAFMGRYSRTLAVDFAAASGVAAGMNVLDLGCGPGALTSVLAELVGADRVSACDPAAAFVDECRSRVPGVDVRQGAAEGIPFDDKAFDAVLTQLVLHFVSDPQRAITEIWRVLRPGGTVAGCVWDTAEGMEMLRSFWDAALSVDPDAPDEARTLRFGNRGEIADLFTGAGFLEVRESTITVRSAYADFDELWSGFLAGVGPAGAYCVSLPEQKRSRVRAVMADRLGSPTGPFTLEAVARCAVGRLPEGE
jgi:SAM-dependent methyltransferase